MTGITQMLQALAGGDEDAAEQLLSLVYDELRELAAAKMARERSGHTLDATALVHEAWIRLAGQSGPQEWQNRRHFFAAAAEAMRRILIENARRRKRVRRGGAWQRIELSEDPLSTRMDPDELLAIDELLARLGQEDPAAAEIVKLRYFAGFTVDEAADCLGISRATAYRHWTYARAWLQCELQRPETRA
jgi:RNA polymerase sigma factor (TIGR02999 family)